MSEPIRDDLGQQAVRERDTCYTGRVWDVVSDTFDLGEAGSLTRDYVRHTGAVAVLAIDDGGRVLVIQQYRHPVGARDWELPAGLLDVPGEAAVEAAKRELFEEADHTAATWATLVDYWSSPGGSSEALRIFVATDLAEVAISARFERSEEELGMPVRWVPLDELVDGVLAGRLGNPSLVVGVLAAQASRARGWADLRPADAPWPAHPDHRQG